MPKFWHFSEPRVALLLDEHQIKVHASVSGATLDRQQQEAMLHVLPLSNQSTAKMNQVGNPHLPKPQLALTSCLIAHPSTTSREAHGYVQLSQIYLPSLFCFERV